MIKIISYLIALGLLIAISVKLAEDPGLIKIEWLEYQISSSMAAVILILIALTVSIFFISKTLRVVLKWVSPLLGYRDNNRLNNILNRLTDGFIAALIRDRYTANRIIEDVESSIGPHQLINILKTQNEENPNFDIGSEVLNSALLEGSRTKQLGVLRAAERQAKDRNYSEAIKILTEGQNKKQNNILNLRSILDIQIMQGKWESAIKFIINNKILGLNLEGHQILEKLYLFAAKEKLSKKEPEAAERLAKASLKFNSQQNAIRTILAYALINQNKIKKAEAIIIEAWKLGPTRDLIKSYKKLEPNETDTAFAARIKKLVSENSGHPLSHLVKTEAYIKADLHGEVNTQMELIKNESLDAHDKIPLLALVISHYAKTGNQIKLIECVENLITSIEIRFKEDISIPKSFVELESIHFK